MDKTGFQLDLDSGGACKQNGTSLDHIFKQGLRNDKQALAALEGAYDDYDDEDFGPETDVDTVDDVLLSPAIAAAKMLASKNQLLIENQTAADVSPELQKDQLGEFDVSAPRGDTPTPPADEVASANREVEVENAGESGEDSEDEWNYFAIEPKKKPVLEAIPLSQGNIKDCDTCEVGQQDSSDMESRLNPNAAEFIPSPTHVVPGLEECLLACSPRKDEKREIAAVPSEQEFDQEARKCPSQEIEQLDNHIALVNDAIVKPQFGDTSSSNELQSTVLQPQDFFNSSMQVSKNPFADSLKNEINGKMSLVQNEGVCNFKFDSESCIKKEFPKNASEPMSFELKKEICPEMEPEPERVCLDTLVDIAENGISPTVSPDVCESSNKAKIEFEPFLAICPQKPADLEDLQFVPEQTFESLVGQIQAELKESAEAVLSSCTTLPDTTGLDETGGSLSPLDTEAMESKPNSSSDRHLFECEPEIILESKFIDNTSLSESTTDSSPVNDLIVDSNPLDKHIEDASPLSENSEAYKPLQADFSPLEGHIESLGVRQEVSDSVSPSHKYFGDDVPFHGFMESELLHDHAENVCILQKNVENEIPLERFESPSHLFDGVDKVGLCNRIEDAKSFHDLVEDVVSSQDRVEDVASSQDRVEDVASSQDRVEDVASSQDRVEDVASSQDRVEDVASSQDRVEDVASSQDRVEDVASSQDRVVDVASSQDRVEDVASSQDHVEYVASSQDHVEYVASSQDHVEYVASSQDRVEDVASSQDSVEDVASSQDHIESITMHEKLAALSSPHFDNALHREEDSNLNSFGFVSSTTLLDQKIVQEFETSVYADSSSVDLKSPSTEQLSVSPLDNIVKAIVEPEVSDSISFSQIAKLEKGELDIIPSAPDSLLLEGSESLKFAAEVLEKESKGDKEVPLLEVSRSQFEGTQSSQTPPSTPAVIEPATGVVPKFEPEVLVESVEQLIVSPNKENSMLEQLQESKVDDAADKTKVPDVAAATAVAAVAALTAGAVLATEKTEAKGPKTGKAPASSKAKKPLIDKTKSPAVQKSSVSQKTVAASPRGPSTAASRAPSKPSVSPTKTLTPLKKTATPITKLKSATTTPVTSSTPTSTSASSTPKSKPLSARPSVGGVKPSVPLKSSAPVKVRLTSAGTKAAATEKKPAPIVNGTMTKPPVREPVAIKRTVSSAKTLGSVPSTATSPKLSISRSATTKTTTTLAGVAAKPKSSLSPSKIGTTKPRAPSSTVTQKQVKETANKQISSARPSSAISVSRTSTTTTTSRRVTGNVTKTTTTTASPKSNLGSKVTTKKTTTITSRTSVPAKAKSQAIENNEQITTTVIATEMKVDPIETTQHALLE